MLIQAGEPILLKDFAEGYAADPQGTVRRLTALLEKRMQDLLLNTKDEEEDQLLHVLEEILRDDAPLPLPDFFQRSKALLSHLRNFAIEHADQHAVLVAQVQAYDKALRSAQLRSGGVYLAQIEATQRNQKLFYFWLLSPIWGFAWINHLPVLALCRWVVRKLNLHVGYKSAVEMSVGLLAMPIYYVLVYNLIRNFSSWVEACIYIFAMIGSGLAFLKNKRRIEGALSYFKMSKGGPLKDKLSAERAAIGNQLQQLIQ
jgi:hypothetical protein